MVDIIAKGEIAMKEENIPLSDAKFFVWLRSHVYWIQLTQYTLDLYHKLEESSPSIKDSHDRATQDQGISLVEALKEYRKLHFEKAFNLCKGRMRATFDPEQQPHLPCTARRLFYRYKS